MLNYYIGVINIEPEDYMALDQQIQQILVRNNIHKQPACKERLYIPRYELGRGLVSVEHKSELILMQLYNKFNAEFSTNLRRDAILKVEEKNKTHLSQILSYLKIKYDSKEKILDSRSLKEEQIKHLYSELNEKYNRKKLYNHKSSPLFSMKESFFWLRKGNIRAKDEAALCFLQDRTDLWEIQATAPTARKRKKQWTIWQPDVKEC